MSARRRIERPQPEGAGEAARFVLPALAVAIEAAELAEWVRAAAPDDQLVYAEGPVLPRGAAAVVLAGELAAAGLVRTHQRRGGARGWEYFVVRRATRAVEAPADAPAASVVDDAAAELLALLKRRAALHQPCPTNAEAAAHLGLRDAGRASYLFRLLRDRGLIEIEDRGPRLRRIITLCGGPKPWPRTAGGGL